VAGVGSGQGSEGATVGQLEDLVAVEDALEVGGLEGRGEIEDRSLRPSSRSCVRETTPYWRPASAAIPLRRRQRAEFWTHIVHFRPAPDMR
jgi:hypothetical protein